MTTGSPTSRPLVSTEWLADHLDEPDVRVVDCRWYLRPFDDRCGDDEYRKGHVPGAVHLRWDTQLADPDRPASMLAPPERFAGAMRAAGIGDDTFVVTYDDHHVPVAARVWWALRAYEHVAVSVLGGGGLRGIRGTRHVGHREHGPGRSGGIVSTHRELPRLPGRDHRHRAHRRAVTQARKFNAKTATP